jgi:dUTP pyrophosphatase
VVRAGDCGVTLEGYGAPPLPGTAGWQGGCLPPPLSFTEGSSILTDLVIPIRRLDPDLPLPAYAHPGDAGADLFAAAGVTLAPGERAVVPTGVAIALPAGYAGFVHPRSGLAARAGLALVNAPGTIDAGYRGEIKVIVVNLDPVAPIELRRGDRIAQLVVQRVEQAEFTVVPALPESARAEGGFGSTGGHASTGNTAGTDAGEGG